MSSRALIVVVLVALAGLAAAACGRSGLDDYLLMGDGGGLPDGRETSAPDVTPCSATNCPSGCCDGTGTCQVGAATTQCGTGGELCANCPALGFTECDPVQHACSTVTPGCSGSTCSGCCAGTECISGRDPNACGFEGTLCTDCAQFGETCNGGHCVPQETCGADSCSFGCCDGNGVCEPGNSDVSCGEGGTLCENCGEVGGSCQNQVCSTACGVDNCPGCCDDSGVCQLGNATNACGFGGNTCAVCASFGGSCENLQCVTACTPQNCQGCCDGAQICQPGLLDEQCGGEGSPCVDCATQMPPSRCDASLLPRACASQ